MTLYVRWGQVSQDAFNVIYKICPGWVEVVPLGGITKLPAIIPRGTTVIVATPMEYLPPLDLLEFCGKDRIADCWLHELVAL